METGKQIGSEVLVLDGSKLLEAPETLTLDPEREKQMRADEAVFEDWLRARGGQPWFEGIVMQCVERFPWLDRFQVSAVIYKLRDEASTLDEKRQSQESIERLGFDPRALSPEELTALIRRCESK